jgi:glycosyltransferase involved in cell wall biosynthesis
MAEPLVSIITPVYNAAATLRRAWESVRAQSYAAWEHIVVDDGSTDTTPEILRELAPDSRVKTMRIANRGPGAALNHGIDIAAGEFFAFLDADDEYLPEHVAAHVRAMQGHPKTDLLWGGVHVIADRPEDVMVPDIETGVGLISVYDCVVQGTIFARREVFRELRFTEDRAIWWHDSELVGRVRRRFRVDRFNGTTYRYYRNSGTSMVDRAKAELPKAAWA